MEPADSRDTQPTPPSKPLGLALSGGGFRATLFHLGVIQGLRERDVLRRVGAICSVSGGSVLAAHMVQKWDEYTGTEDEFKKVAEELIRFTSLDVRGHILRRLGLATVGRLPIDLLLRIAPGAPARPAKMRLTRWSHRLRATGLLTRQYQRLFGKATLDSLEGENRPDLCILATNLNTLQRCSFGAGGFSWGPDCERPVAKGVLEIAQAVSASSAFPGFFPPFVLTREVLGLDEKIMRFPELYLTDGGVYDNLGTSFFRRHLNDGTLECVLVSDGTGRTDWTGNRRVSRLAGTTIRAIDVFMTRSRDLQGQLADEHLGKTLFINISEELGRDDSKSTSLGRLPATYQRQLKYIRTDLDAMPESVGAALMDHGFAVCRSKLQEQFGPLQQASYTPLLAREKDAGKGLDELQRARYRKLGLLSRKDVFASVGTVALAVATVLLVALAALQFRPLAALLPSIGHLFQHPQLTATVSGLRRPPSTTRPTHAKPVYRQTISYPRQEAVEVFERTEEYRAGMASLDEASAQDDSDDDLYEAKWIINRPLAQRFVHGILIESVESEPGVSITRLIGVSPGEDAPQTATYSKARTFELDASDDRHQLHYELPDGLADPPLGRLFVVDETGERLHEIELKTIEAQSTHEHAANVAGVTSLNPFSASAAYAREQRASKGRVSPARLRDWLTSDDPDRQTQGRAFLVDQGELAFPTLATIVRETSDRREKATLLHNVTTAFEQAGIRTETVTSDLRVAIGTGYYELQNFAGTVKFLAGVPDNEITSDRVFFFRGVAHSIEGMYDEAITDLEKFYQRASDPRERAIALSNLGISSRHLERFDDAKNYYERAIDQDGDYPDPYNNLAYMYALTSTAPDVLDEGLRLVDVALGYRPTDPSFLDTKGWLYCRKGEYEKGHEYLRQAEAGWPGDSGIVGHLRTCNEQAGGRG